MSNNLKWHFIFACVNDLASFDRNVTCISFSEFHCEDSHSYWRLYKNKHHSFFFFNRNIHTMHIISLLLASEIQAVTLLFSGCRCQTWSNATTGRTSRSGPQSTPASWRDAVKRYSDHQMALEPTLVAPAWFTSNRTFVHQWLQVTMFRKSRTLHESCSTRAQKEFKKETILQ